MKILIELPSWLGDTVMATPAIENIVNFQNNVEITLIGSSLSIEALRNHKKVVNTIILNKDYRSIFRQTSRLGSFDLFLTFKGSYRSKILKLLVSAKKKYQFNKHRYKNRHQVEKYNDYINECLNTNFLPGKLVINKSLNNTTSHSKLILGLNPGASYGSAKRWYPEEFSKVASKLSSIYDIVILGGYDEIDIANDIEKSLIERGISNYKNLAGKTSISQLISQISVMDLFITGDSGPMHLAAAFEVPTISIFGPTRDYETSQWMNEKNIIIKKNLDCQPCMKRKCPLKHHNCMKQIKTSDVLNASKSLLNE